MTTNPNKLEEQAKEYLGITSFNYVAGGAGEKATMDANRLALRQWKAGPTFSVTTHSSIANNRGPDDSPHAPAYRTPRSESRTLWP